MSDVATPYERAGMTAAEFEHLERLIGAVEAGDPFVGWVAVRRADVRGVVAALDRLVDAAAGSGVERGAGG